MAGANLSDTVDELCRVVAQLFRLTAPAGVIRPNWHGPAGKAAGMSAAQVEQFLGGGFVPPPRQGLACAASLLDQWRMFELARLESARGEPAAAAPESTAEGVETAAAELREAFPGWLVSLPTGYRKLGSGETVKLVWRARQHGSALEVAGVSAAELAGKMRLREAADARAAKQHQAYMEG